VKSHQSIIAPATFLSAAASCNNSSRIFSTAVRRSRLDIRAASHPQNSAFCRKHAGLSSANGQDGHSSGRQNLITHADWRPSRQATSHDARPLCILIPCPYNAKRIHLALENPTWCAVARHCWTGRRSGNSAVPHSDWRGSFLFAGRDGAARGGDRL
jgi:hypothetical protein